MQLAELLLRLHIDGRLSAKDTCTISHWAAKAGAIGPARSLAYPPNAPTGHFQRHLDRVAGLRGGGEKFLKVRVPAHTKYHGDRTVLDILMVPPHECLHQEVVEDPSILEKINAAEWPAHYHEHPVVRSAGDGKVLPLAFYIDAAQYTKLGAAAVVFVVCNMTSGSRHLVAVLKKRDFCRCGCRGWCSLRPVFAFLRWYFAALASGHYPPTGPDGVALAGDGSELRRSLSGLPLAMRGAVFQVKGDWAEYAHSLGFPSWRHTQYPCLWCHCDRDSMYDWDDMDAGLLPWAPTTAGDYEEACARCERLVVIATPALRARVAALLFYDKRTLGSRGRALRDDLPELRLLAGDRLEPSPGCLDVGAFEALALPATVVFWRQQLETITKHRNPIFDTFAGISIETLTVDTLNCFYLGILQTHCSQVIWGFVEADVWHTRLSGHTTAPARLQESCTRLQAALASWCRQRRRDHPEESVTDVQEMSPYILGTSRAEQRLGLKGGETKTVFMYLHDVLPSHAAAVANSRHMLAASNALSRHIALLKAAPWRFTAGQEEDRRCDKLPLHPGLQSVSFIGSLRPGCALRPDFELCCRSALSGVPRHPAGDFGVHAPLLRVVSEVSPVAPRV